jgi:hypothetical protein
MRTRAGHPPRIRLLLRLPPPMRQWLEAKADEACTNLNFEAVQVLRAAMLREQEQSGKRKREAAAS